MSHRDLPIIHVFRIRFALSSVTSYNYLYNNFSFRVTKIRFGNCPDEHFTRINILIQSPGHSDFEIFIDWEPCRAKPAEREKVWGRDVEVELDGDKITLVASKRHDARMIAVEMSQLLLKVFKTDDVKLASYGSESDKELFTCLKGVRHFSRVAIRWHTPNCINLEKLESLLSNLAADTLHLNVFLPRVQYTGAINKRVLIALNASWLTGESLLNMDCEHLYVNGTKLSTDDINMFVKDWQSNTEKYKNLKMVYIQQHEKFPLNPWELCMEKWPPSGEHPRDVENPDNMWYCWRGNQLASFEISDHIEMDGVDIDMDTWIEERVKIGTCVLLKVSSQ